ncbi:MAG: fructosamine kinase family protein, partial [bacterium]
MSWTDPVVKSLSEKYGRELQLLSVDPVGGGSINDTFRLTTTKGEFFIKKNSVSRFPEMFEKEVQGLEILRNADELPVP